MVYVFAAYTLIWLGLLWYAFGISGQNRRLAIQVEALEATLTARERKGSAAAAKDQAAARS